MRKLLFVLIAASCLFTGRAQMTSKIDPKFELTSIAFRLAGANEYAQCGVPEYAKAIDAYFLPYVDHPLIGFIQQIRRDYGIGYDAVSSSADWLMIKDGKVKLQPQYKVSDISKAEQRWTEPVFSHYLKLLNDFYRKTKFQEFYDANGELYGYATTQLDALLNTIDTDWFERYYGISFGNPDIFIGLCNGPSNYALTEKSRYVGYGIVVGCGSDMNGKPAYNPMFSSIILHEFAHNYSNPLIDAHWNELEKSADIIYSNVAAEMSQLAYGSARTTLSEWFDNLCVTMYYRETQPELVGDLVSNYENMGFIWMGRSVKLMDEFYADRTRYPDISDFMPRIIEFVSETANDFKQVKKEYAAHSPYIVETFPAIGSSVSVAEAPKEVVIRFSEPMFTGRYGFAYMERGGVVPFPIAGKPVWRDEYTIVLSLQSNSA